MVTNVTSLLKTAKAVEDEYTRGTRALKSTIEAISQELNALDNMDNLNQAVNPEDLVRCTKSITVATAKAVAAGSSGKQDDIIMAADMGRKAIVELLAICKGVAYNCAETEDLRRSTILAGNDVAIDYRKLLQAMLELPPGHPAEAKSRLLPISLEIAQSVNKLVQLVKVLKGNLTDIAENELLGAAASIDAAVQKLDNLRPRRNVQVSHREKKFDF